jgi:outer membrane protein assembly factor BamB
MRGSRRLLMLTAAVLAVAVVGALPASAANHNAPNNGWPNLGYNPQMNGASPYAGPAKRPHVRWQIQCANNQQSASPVIGPDGTVFMETLEYLTAIRNGRIAWRLVGGSTANPEQFAEQIPVLSPDGSTIYCATRDAQGPTLSAYLTADGTRQWSASAPIGWLFQSTLLAATDGTVYVAGSGGAAISPSGVTSWTSTQMDQCVAMSPDESCLYSYTGPSSVGKFDAADGRLVWTANLPGVKQTYGKLSVGPDGTVYASDDTGLNALDPDGSLKWSHVDAYVGESKASVGPDGIVYIAFGQPFTYPSQPLGGVMALYPADGSVKWRKSIGELYPAQQGYAAGNISVDPDSRIYFSDGDVNITCIDGLTGTFLWKIPTGGYTWWSEPVIGANGTVYYFAWDGYLRALGSKK